MDREATKMTVRQLRGEFPSIEFPEYQREPSVWNREQKQRLIDSMLRGFDISAIYLYRRSGDDVLECIDGRQRLNAIMSFLGENPEVPDESFVVHIENDVAQETRPELAELEGARFEDLGDRKEAFLDYELIAVVLSDLRDPDEFNMQFLRLNLGTLINAGEKLHAMLGKTRNFVFEEGGLGSHPFLDRVQIPTRRYAREQIATQILLQVSTRIETQEFARARHFDLQKYLKTHAGEVDPHAAELVATLDALEAHAPGIGDRIKSRALCVSIVLAAWELGVRETNELPEGFADFTNLFLDRLAEQVALLKEYKRDQNYDYLVTFQRHLTQAAVEKPAVRSRNEILSDEYHQWVDSGKLTGDS